MRTPTGTVVQRVGMAGLMVLSSALVLGVQGQAWANDEDKAACADLEEGDPCERSDGEAGTCQPDESDPDVLTCEDEASSSSDGSSGGSSGDDDEDSDCSVGGPGSRKAGGAALLALGLLGVGVSRRSRRRR